jgi:uncharacterized integral membrane protein
MRLFFFLVLLVLLAAVGIFAYENDDKVQIWFLNYSLTASLALIIGAAYVLGMLSGWSVVGFLKRSFERVTERQ